MDLQLRVKTVDGATVVEVAGEIDLHWAPQLRAALIEASAAEKPCVVVDLGEVSFLDSTGIGVLVGALKRAREKGGALGFCGVKGRVRRVFEVTGLVSALPIFESCDAALEAFAREKSNG